MSKIVDKLKIKYNKKIINILGADYTILLKTPKEDPSFTGTNMLAGYCSYNDKILCINCNPYYYKDKKDEWIINDMKEVIRHEIFHAFFNESGLGQSAFQYNGPWSCNEEMIDWLAMQSPKIFKIFTELEII